MKKITVLALSTALLSTTAFTGETDANLIKNGSFELIDSKGQVSSWNPSEWNKKEYRGTITLKQVDDSTDGKKAAQVDSSFGKGNLLIIQKFTKPAKVAKKYKVTLKFKGAKGGSVYTSFHASVPKNKTIKPQYIHSKKMKGSDEWQELTASYEIDPAMELIQLFVRFSRTPVIIDDVKVVEVTE